MCAPPRGVCRDLVSYRVSSVGHLLMHTFFELFLNFFWICGLYVVSELGRPEWLDLDNANKTQYVGSILDHKHLCCM